MRRLTIVMMLLATAGAAAVMAADGPPALLPRAESARCNLCPSPFFIYWPEYTKPSVQRDFEVPVENFRDVAMNFLSIVPQEDSAKPSAPTGWMAISNAPTSVPPLETRYLTLHLNAGGVVTTGPTSLFGHLVFTYQHEGDTLTRVVAMPIHFTVADTIVMPEWDTITTQCGIPLTMSTNGNIGNNFRGGANMGFPQPSPECDIDGGTLNPGDASIYLGDASPVVIRKSGNDFTASWSIFQDALSETYGFKPLYPSSNRGHFSAARWEGYNTGTFCTADSLVKLERTYWAPQGATNADSCHFVIIRTRFFPYSIGMSVSNLAIGDAFDWDVPTDSGTSGNISGTDPTRRLVYMRGFNSLDPETGCYDNSLRYGGAALLGMYMKNSIWPDSNLYAGYNAANDSSIYLEGGFVPEELWANMQLTGYSNETRITDLHSLLVYKNGSAGIGWTLPANDTLTIWTAIAVVRPSGGTAAQGLDSLKKEIDKARKWFRNMGPAEFSCGCCCIGPWRGNVNGGVLQTPDLSDLSLLVAYLTADPRPALPMFAEADVNADCKIDLSDLSCLIDKLTNPTSTCIRQC